MKKNLIITAALLAALAVVSGAFGAHALKERLTAEQLQVYEVGVRYHFYHAFAILIAGMLYKEVPGKLLIWAGKFFIAGIILFSGSLYLLSNVDGLKKLGMLTPVGGLCFITGWVLLAIGIAKRQ